MIRFACGTCNERLAVPERFIGRAGKCPACGGVNVVPATSAFAEPAAPRPGRPVAAHPPTRPVPVQPPSPAQAPSGPAPNAWPTPNLTPAPTPMPRTSGMPVAESIPTVPPPASVVVPLATPDPEPVVAPVAAVTTPPATRPVPAWIDPPPLAVPLPASAPLPTPAPAFVDPPPSADPPAFAPPAFPPPAPERPTTPPVVARAEPAAKPKRVARFKPPAAPAAAEDVPSEDLPPEPPRALLPLGRMVDVANLDDAAGLPARVKVLLVVGLLGVLALAIWVVSYLLVYFQARSAG